MDDLLEENQEVVRKEELALTLAKGPIKAEAKTRRKRRRLKPEEVQSAQTVQEENSQELVEDEELDLALAIGQSEAEAKARDQGDLDLAVAISQLLSPKSKYDLDPIDDANFLLGPNDIIELGDLTENLCEDEEVEAEDVIKSDPEHVAEIIVRKTSEVEDRKHREDGFL